MNNKVTVTRSIIRRLRIEACDRIVLHQTFFLSYNIPAMNFDFIDAQYKRLI